jgi:hypothetical protein
VPALWSVTVYDADGFIPKNDLVIYSYNSVTARPDGAGSFTIHFGGDENQIHYLPITEGRNYTNYEPAQEIRDGSWVFPKIVPVAQVTNGLQLWR